MMKKNKSQNIRIFLPIFFGVILVIIYIYTTRKSSNILMIIFGVLLLIIPYVYSVLPIMHERNKEKNTFINRLSENTFTDRQKDLQELINLINEYKIIQLIGKEHKCGKSWLAFKLIDYIRHPKDIEFKKYVLSKSYIKKVYYVDLQEMTELDLNLFFENNIINKKTLIVTDHVKKIDAILSKQNIYGFSLIFIPTSCIETKGIVYQISDFASDNIPILQENIKHNYSNIETLNEKEIAILYQLTFGNIGKIHFILERQEYVKWIKQLASNLQTTYDKELNSIQLDLYKGDYSIAKKKLDNFAETYRIALSNNNDLFFKYYIMKSDCEHLLNNYQNALSLLYVLKNRGLISYNQNNKIEILEAHYNKHLWKCNEALLILQKIQEFNICGLTDSLGILVAKYFVDDLSVPYSNLSSLETFLNNFKMCQTSLLQKDDWNVLKIMRNEAIYLYYKNSYNDINDLIKPINDVIEGYKAENNRLLANAYFIRAEINRLFKKYKLALLDYNSCTLITDDDNIKIQVNIMKYYLAKIQKIRIFKGDNFLSKDEICDLCKGKNNYGMLLVHRLNSIELNDPDKEQIVNCFEHRIMTIL